MVSALLSYGVFLEAADDIGNTVLMQAVDRASLPIVTTLLQAGAKVNIHNTQGMTPLLLAVKKKQRGIMQTLLAAGAELEARPNKESPTPLELAMAQGDVDAVKILLAMGAECSEDAARLLPDGPVKQAVVQHKKEGKSLFAAIGSGSSSRVF